MRTPVTTITTGWRITIPSKSRKGLEIGDVVIVEEDCIRKAKIVIDKEKK